MRPLIYRGTTIASAPISAPVWLSAPVWQRRARSLQPSRCLCTGWPPSAVAAVAALALGCGSLRAQQGSSHPIAGINFGSSDHSAHGSQERAVQGLVEDMKGVPVPGARIYLKNNRTSSINSVVADANGSYRFGPLASDTDYEIWAQAGTLKSATKPLSSFLSGPVTMPLQVGAATPAGDTGTAQNASPQK